MKHADDRDLLALIAGHPPDELRGQVDRHVADCAECRGRLDEMRRVHQLLGEWDVTAGGSDLAPAVVAAARREAPTAAAPAWRRHAPALLRVAAALVVGAGLGHLGARALRPAGEGGAGVGGKVEAAAAAQALSLTVFEEASPAGLAESLLGVEPAVDEEASS